MVQSCRRSRAVLALLPVLLTASCGEILGMGGDVEIRIRNVSTHDFASVVVSFPEQTEDYGALPAAGVTGYRKISKAYSYAGIEVRLSDDRVLVLQPVDYVGEKPLHNGRYTYQLGVSPSGQFLTHQLVVDCLDNGEPEC